MMPNSMHNRIVRSEDGASAPLAPMLVPNLRSAPAPEKDKQEESDSPFAVSVSDVYEGPLDLLLDLIRKQDIDIYDIPIARITEQYLAYVEKIRDLDVNIAADFIYMAAVLIHIKSKMLLPRDPSAKAEELEDPRAELVNRLLEHEKFKSAAQMLLQKQQIEDAVLTNPALKEFMDAEGTEPEIAADVIDLVKTFQQILERVRTRPVINVDEETVTVGQMIDYLRRRLALESRPIRLKQLRCACLRGRRWCACFWRCSKWCGCRRFKCGRTRCSARLPCASIRTSMRL